MRVNPSPNPINDFALSQMSLEQEIILSNQPVYQNAEKQHIYPK